MNNKYRKHLYSLKGMINTDRVATDDWQVKEYDVLDDLDFELDQYEMTFKYEYIIAGENKYLHLTVYKKRDGTWVLEIKKKHWVIALSKIWGGYWVADPWDSRRKFMLNSSVSGGSVLIKNL